MKPDLDSEDSRPRKNRVVVSATEECAAGSAIDQTLGREKDLKGNWGQQQHRTGKQVFKIKAIL